MFGNYVIKDFLIKLIFAALEKPLVELADKMIQRFMIRTLANIIFFFLCNCTCWSIFGFLIQMPSLLYSMILTPIYVWGRLNKEHVVSAPPWILLVFKMVTIRNFWQDFAGIAISEFYILFLSTSAGILKSRTVLICARMEKLVGILFDGVLEKYLLKSVNVQSLIPTVLGLLVSADFVYFFLFTWTWWFTASLLMETASLFYTICLTTLYVFSRMTKIPSVLYLPWTVMVFNLVFFQDWFGDFIAIAIGELYYFFGSPLEHRPQSPWSKLRTTFCNFIEKW